MIISRLAVCATTAIIFAASFTSAESAEFKGTATFSWTYHDTSIIRIDDSRAYTVGIAEGSNAFDSDDPNLANIAQHCLGANNIDGSASGVCHNLDPSGDGWKETYVVDAPQATPNDGALVSWTGSSEVIPGSGTGKFANVSGGSTFVQDLTGVLLDNTVTGVSVQTYELSY